MTFEKWMFGDGEPDEMADPTGIIREAWNQSAAVHTRAERERLVQFVMGLRTSGCDIDGEPAVSRLVDVFKIAAAIREGENSGPEVDA